MSEELIQRSEAWFLERCGKATASRIADIVAKTKTGWGESRANYASQLIVERLTGKPVEGYTNAAMQWGTEQEGLARDTFSVLSGLTIDERGFIPHPKIAMSGASPDGEVKEDSACVEIKCPNTATHLETLLGAPIDKKYIMQMQWQMACGKYQKGYFVSFDPRLPLELQTKIIVIDRDDALIASLEKDVVDFLGEVSEKVSQLQKMMEDPAKYLRAG